jgi:hypothetical protein
MAKNRGGTPPAAPTVFYEVLSVLGESRSTSLESSKHTES